MLVMVLKILVRMFIVGILLTMGIGTLQAQVEIRVNEPVEASLSNRVAAFVINLDAGVSVSIQATSLRINLSPQISVLSPALAEVANSSNPRQGQGDAKSAAVNFTTVTKGRYVIMVSSQTGQSGTFTLSAVPGRVPVPTIAALSTLTPAPIVPPTTAPPPTAPPTIAPDLAEPCQTSDVLAVISVYDSPNGASLPMWQEFRLHAYARSGQWWLVSPEDNPLFGWYLPENPAVFNTPRCNLLPQIPPFTLSAQRHFNAPVADSDNDGLPDPIDPCPAYNAFEDCFYFVELDAFSPLAMSMGQSVTIPVSSYAPADIPSFIPPGDPRYEVAVDNPAALGFGTSGVPSAILANHVQIPSFPRQPITVTLSAFVETVHLVVTWYDAANNNRILAQDDIYVALASSAGGDNLICLTEVVEYAALLNMPGGSAFAEFFDMDFRAYSTAGNYVLVGANFQIGWLPLAQIIFQTNACNALPVVAGFNVLEPLHPDTAFNDIMRDSDLDGLPTAYDPCPTEAANACVIVPDVNVPSATPLPPPTVTLPPTVTPLPTSPPTVTPMPAAAPPRANVAPADRDYRIELTPKTGSRFSDAVSYPDGDTADTIVVSMTEGEATYMMDVICQGSGINLIAILIAETRQETGCNTSLPVTISSRQPLTINIYTTGGRTEAFVEYTLAFRPQ